MQPSEMTTVPDLTKPWFLSNVIFTFDDEEPPAKKENKKSQPTHHPQEGEEKKIYANKDFLSVASPVMRALFNTEHFCEKDAAEIPLPGKQYDDVSKLMLVIHAPFHVPINDDNVYEILPLAHEYQMDQIVKICETYMQQNPCIKNLFLAEKYELHDLISNFTDMSTPKYMCTTGSENLQYLLDMKPETIIKVFHQKLKCIANAVKRGKFPMSMYGNHMARMCLDTRMGLHRLGENKTCEHCKRTVVTVVTALLNKDEENGQMNYEYCLRFTSKEQESTWHID